MSARHRRPGLLGRLAGLDDRLVPGAAARVQGVADGAAEARRRARAAARGELPTPEPGPGRLDRLDARLTRSGPLAVLRAVPLAGAAVAAALALAGGVAAATLGGAAEDRLAVAAVTSGPEGADPAADGTAPGGPGTEGGGTEPGATPSPATPSSATPSSATPSSATPGPGAPGGVPPGPASVIGPADGAVVADHLAASAADLARLGAEAPTTPVPALVHLAEHGTPQRAADLVAGVPALRAVLRVPLPGEQTAVIPVPAQRLPDDLVIAMPGLAQQLRSRAAADEAAAAGRAPGDPGGEALRAAASLASRQADVLDAGPSCACTVAVLVIGTPAELAPLAGRPGVRAVEPGPAGVPPEQLALRPLLPEQTVTVAPAGAA